MMTFICAHASTTMSIDLYLSMLEISRYRMIISVDQEDVKIALKRTLKSKKLHE